MPFSCSQPVRPAVTSRPSTVPSDSAAGCGTEAGDGGERPAPPSFHAASTAGRRRSGDGAGDRVLGGVLHGPGQAQHLGLAVRARSPGRRPRQGWPVVTVPVLSSRIVSTVRVSSRTCGPLIRMPSWAPRPVPASSPTGVARPRAQGQAMTSTATAAVKAARSSSALDGRAGREQPGPEGEGGDGQDHRDEDGADPVGEPGDGGLAGLRLRRPAGPSGPGWFRSRRGWRGPGAGRRC